MGLRSILQVCSQRTGPVTIAGGIQKRICCSDGDAGAVCQPDFRAALAADQYKRGKAGEVFRGEGVSGDGYPVQRGHSARGFFERGQDAAVRQDVIFAEEHGKDILYSALSEPAVEKHLLRVLIALLLFLCS